MKSKIVSLRAIISLLGLVALLDPAVAQQEQPGGHHEKAEKGDKHHGGAQPNSDTSGPGIVGPAVGSAPTSAPGAGPNFGARGAMPNSLANAVATFNKLKITVATGEDDLRSDSLAWIEVRSADGGDQKCSFKTNELTYENNSTNESTCSLSNPLNESQLKSAKFVLGYSGEAGSVVGSPEAAAAAMSHSTDNWKVNAVRVAVDQTGECLVNASGNPQLVELKGDSPNFTLSGGC